MYNWEVFRGSIVLSKVKTCEVNLTGQIHNKGKSQLLVPEANIASLAREVRINYFTETTHKAVKTTKTFLTRLTPTKDNSPSNCKEKSQENIKEAFCSYHEAS